MTTVANIPTSSQIVSLTPDMAKNLLEANISNRPMRDRYVSKLKNAMLRGEWELNGDTIRVSKSGRLLDGQHRCAAVLASGVTIQVFLISGLDDAVFATIDRGLGRSTSDAMSIRGDANSSAVAAITRLLHIYLASGEPYNGNPDNQPTTTQQIHLVDQNPGINESAKFVKSTTWLRKYIPPSLAGLCHFLFSKKDREASNEFFAGLESGVGLSAGSPVLLLRNRLIDQYSSKEKLSPTYRASLIFKAFKLHLDGATVKTLRVRTDGDAPEKDIFVI